MPRTAAASIAAWLAHGDPSATLVIRDADCTALPPLPTTVTKLYCYWCEQLTALPALPAALTHLRCFGCGLTSLGNLSALPLVAIELSVCRALAALPPLPATLVLLDLNECTALVALPRLPAALTTLQCYWCTALVALPQASAAQAQSTESRRTTETRPIPYRLRKPRHWLTAESKLQNTP